MNSYKFKLFADYFQVYLMDEAAEDDTSEIWTDQALELKLGIAECTLAVGTFRNVDIDLEVEVLAKEPRINLEEWDHVTEGYFKICSGNCAIFGCTEYRPDAKRIPIQPGAYSALSLAKGLDTITAEWEDAEDFYKVILWPSENQQFRAIKRHDT